MFVIVNINTKYTIHCLQPNHKPRNPPGWWHHSISDITGGGGGRYWSLILPPPRHSNYTRCAPRTIRRNMVAGRHCVTVESSPPVLLWPCDQAECPVLSMFPTTTSSHTDTLWDTLCSPPLQPVSYQVKMDLFSPLYSLLTACCRVALDSDQPVSL